MSGIDKICLSNRNYTNFSPIFRYFQKDNCPGAECHADYDRMSVAPKL